MALPLLGCATRSVLDCIRTELRAVLALASGDRSVGHATPRESQLAQPSSLGEEDNHFCYVER